MTLLRNQTSAEPTGSRAPVNSRSDSGPNRPLPRLGDYLCEFPGCERSFNTARGRGVHHRCAHKDWYDSRQNLDYSKRRWNDEEESLMALKEAQLILEGVNFMNIALLEAFPGRTLEAIKKKRQNDKYKRLVQQHIERLEADPGAASAVNEDSRAYLETLKTWILDQPLLDKGSFKEDILNRICRSVGYSDKDSVREEITLYLQEILNEEEKDRPPRRPVRPRRNNNNSKRAKRRQDFAKTQDLWRKNPGKCLRFLLTDVKNAVTPDEEVMVPFWENVMTQDIHGSPGIETRKPIITRLWEPVTLIELKRARPTLSSAPGPDGVTARKLRTIPLRILLRIYNIILWCGKAPRYLLKSRTTMIPKKEQAYESGDFRPISVYSVVIRTLHKVLATRMMDLVELDERQKAFQPVDGCSENVFLMDIILRHHREKQKQLFMASMDMAKAFDSVTHETIKDVMIGAGLPQTMVEYIVDIYENSTTQLSCGDWTSHEIRPTCGLKQGDPLSPMILNLVIDGLLKKLTDEIGVSVDNIKANSFAFADDLALVASTRNGLQELINRSVEYLLKCGLKVNAGKCLTVAIRTVPPEKKTVVDPNTTFKCLGRILPAVKRTSEWKYLGIPFTPEGKFIGDPLGKLKSTIEILSKAPLRPQQKLFGLRVVGLPSLYHLLTLGSANISLLKKIDRKVRNAVKSWLRLPMDTPSAYIHASVLHGGLGIPSMRWTIPLMRFNRLKNLPFYREDLPTYYHISREVKSTLNRLKDGDNILTTKNDIDNRMAEMLHKAVDGIALKDSAKVPQQHRWIMEGNNFMNGRDFIELCRIRINALPLKSRTTRGRAADRRCRAGCNNVETLNHILQQCPRTHEKRIKRHDALVKYIGRSLVNSKFEVEEEPHFQTPEGLRKPDLIAKRGNMAVLIDGQVVSEQADLARAQRMKAEKYQGLKRQIEERFGVKEVHFTAATLSARGIWSKTSAADLVRLGALKVRDFKVISTRVLIGGVAIFKDFNRRTSRAAARQLAGVHPRQGVG